MLIFIFMLIICSSVYFSYVFANKISNQRKQIILLKHQNDALKTKIPSIDNKMRTSLVVKYLTPDVCAANLLEDCNLCLSPLEDSYILCHLKENSYVTIKDCALIDNQIWYEISISNESNINNKGWIKDFFIRSEP